MSKISLIYEDIPDTNNGRHFGKAIYGTINVIMMKENDYINVTDICKQGNKCYSEWCKNSFKKSLFDEMSSASGIPLADLSIQVIGGKCKEIRGTYIYRKLVSHVASWVSSKFAVLVCDIIDDYLLKEHKDKLKEQKRVIKKAQKKLLKKDQEIQTKNDNIIQKEQEIVIKDNRIDELLVEVKKLRVDTKLVLEDTKVMKGELKDTKDVLITTNTILNNTQNTLVDVREDFKDVHDELYITNTKLNIVLDQRVPPEQDLNKQGVFMLVKLDTPVTYSGTDYQYYVIRGQEMTAKRMTKCKGKIILELDCHPNPGNLYTRVKKDLEYIGYKYNYISTTKKERHLIRDITSINNDKYIVKVPQVTKKDILYSKTMPELKDTCRTMGYGGFTRYKNKDSLITFMLEQGY